MAGGSDEAPDVLETGVPNLDLILGGGLVRRSLANNLAGDIPV